MKGKDLYIISFGTSNEYRYYSDHMQPEAEDVAAEIKHELVKEYPSMANLHFLEKIEVHRVGKSDESKYQGYPMLDAEAIKNIETHLCVEAKNKADVQQAILNAPYSDIDTKG